MTCYRGCGTCYRGVGRVIGGLGRVIGCGTCYRVCIQGRVIRCAYSVCIGCEYSGV